MSIPFRPTLVGTLLTAATVLFVANFYVFVRQLDARHPAVIAAASVDAPVVSCTLPSATRVIHVHPYVQILEEAAREKAGADSRRDRSMKIVIKHTGTADQW
jgi:hypothetical protein